MPLKTKTEYCLLTNENINKLNMEANRLLELGWELYGSPCASGFGNFRERFYCQALIKKTTNLEKPEQEGA